MIHNQQTPLLEPLWQQKSQNHQINVQLPQGSSIVKSVESISTIVSQLSQFLNKPILQQAFQLIHRHSQALKTKQLIYAAIYSKNPKPQKQSLTTRKKKQDHKIQIIKRQSQESFHFNTDDISTIVLQKSQKQTIGRQSRIDLENLLAIGTKQFGNKFIYQNNTNFNHPPYFLSAKRSRTDKSDDQGSSDESFCKNLHFQNFMAKNSSTQKPNDSLEYSKTIKIKTKLTKQTDKSTVHKIFIFRQTPKKLRRPISQDFTERAKFIEIPLKSKNVKIIECNKASKKQHRSSQSLNSKPCLNTCTSASFKFPANEECKYCQRIQKSREMLEKWRKQFYEVPNGY